MFDSQPRIEPGFRNASVAVIWNVEDELLFIERSINENDPWSGHMGFPGGHKKSEESVVDAAIRETFEEVGYRLRRDQCVGHLESVQGRQKGGRVNLFVHPVVFKTEDRFEDFVLDPAEVQSVHWVSLGQLTDKKNLQWRELHGANWPCIPHLDNIIWGLTLLVSCRLILEIDEKKILSFGDPIDHIRELKGWARG